MFGIGPEELLLIMFIALLVLGPERMPKLARDLGKFVNDMRRTSDELRDEFLNADKLLERAANLETAKPETPAIAAVVPEAAPAPTVVEPTVADAGGVVPDAGATEAAVTTDGTPAETRPVPLDETATPGEPAETAFDREAREARERLHDPERAKRAAAEGWKKPTDEAGTSDRWG